MKLSNKLSYSAFLLLLIALTAINSCERDTLTAPSLNNPRERSQIVNYAKLWFESKYPKSVKLSDKLNIKSINDWYTGLKPDWNSAFVYKRGKETLIELPLENAKVAFVPFAKDSSQVNLTNNYARTSYVISRDSLNNMQAWFMVLIADTSYVNGDFTKLALNTYKSRDTRFSGRLLYYDPSGDFLAGWRYEHGVITKTLSVTNDKIDYKPAKQQINVAQVCHSYPVVTTTVTCVTVPNQPQMNCTYTYTTIHVTECFYQDGGGGSGGGGGGGGSGGGGSSGGGGGTFPQPPGPGCPVVGVASVGNQRINIIGGNPCPPEAPDPCDDAKRLAQDNVLAAEMNDLKSKVNGNFEAGYFKTDGASPQYLSGTVGSYGWPTPPVASLANNSLEYILHNHHSDLLALSTFSGDDIITFFRYIGNNKVKDINTFQMSVTTSFGTSYSMVVTDPSKFNAAFSTYFGDALGASIFNGMFNNAVNTNNTPAVNEVGLLKLIQATDLGVAILKADGNFSTYQVLTLDPVTLEIKIKNCP